MRKLTIERRKSFVGCLSKMKVYIEDPTSSELVINDTPCRKLGDLLNGEKKCFVIDSRPARVFVIADKMSKNFCNDFYALDEGDGEVFLSGQNKYNPIMGNPFYFDDNGGDEALNNRNKNLKKSIIICIIAAIVGMSIGFTVFFIARSSKETFTFNGMSITLPDKFREEHYEGWTVAYMSDEVGIFVYQEEFSQYPEFEHYTAKNYAYLVQKSYGVDAEIKTEDGLTYFEYHIDATNEHDPFDNYVFIYKTDDSFWVVEFSEWQYTHNDYTKRIFKWAKSVEFED